MIIIFEKIYCKVKHFSRKTRVQQNEKSFSLIIQCILLNTATWSKQSVFLNLNF